MSDKLSIETALERDGVILHSVTGRSMLPLLRPDRDAAEISKISGDISVGDVVLFKAADRYILHRVVDMHGESFTARGDHNYFSERGITRRQIVGVMAAAIRNGRRVDVTSRGYRRYVRFWCAIFPLRAPMLYASAKIRAAAAKLLRR